MSQAVKCMGLAALGRAAAGKQRLAMAAVFGAHGLVAMPSRCAAQSTSGTCFATMKFTAGLQLERVDEPEELHQRVPPVAHRSGNHGAAGPMCGARTASDDYSALLLPAKAQRIAPDEVFRKVSW